MTARTRQRLRRAGLLAALVLLSLRLPPGQAALARGLEAWLSDRLGGEVRVDRLRTNLWDRLSLSNLRVRTPTAEIGLVRLELRLSGGWPVADGLDRVWADSLRLRRRPGDGGRAAAARAPGADLRPWLPAAARLRGLRLEAADGTPRLQVAGDLRWERAADGARALAVGRLDGDSLTVVAGRSTPRGARLRSRWEMGRSWLSCSELELEAGQLRLRAGGSLEAGAFAARARLEGPVAGLPDWLADWRPDWLPDDLSAPASTTGRLQASVAAHGPLADPLVHAELSVTGAAPGGIGVDSLRVRGTWTAAHAVLDTIAAAGAFGRLGGAGVLRIAAGDTALQMRAALTDVDLALAAPSRLLGARARGRTEGRVRLAATLSPGGRRLTDGAADLRVRGAGLGGIGLGEVELTADYTASQLRARLASALGVLQVDGTLQDRRAHDLHWRIERLDLAPLAGLTGGAAVTGGGGLSLRSRGSLHRPTLAGQARLRDVGVGGLRVGPLQARLQADSTGAFTAAVTDGRGASHLLATGSWTDRSLHLATLSVAGVDLSRYLAGPARRDWRGAVSLELDLQGDLENPEAVGAVRLEGLSLRGQPLGDVRWRFGLSRGRARVALAALDSTVRLVGVVDLRAQGLPVRLQGFIVDAQLQPLLALLAEEPLGYTGTLAATLEVRGPLTAPERLDADIGLRTLRVRTPAGGLDLEAPGQAQLRDGVVSLTPLRFGGSAGRMSVEGRAARRGPLDLRYRLEDLELAFLEPFLRPAADPEAAVSGRLTGGLDIAGTAAGPQIRGQISVADLTLGPHRLGQLTGELAYAGRTVRLERLDLALPAGGVVRGTAHAPWRLPVGGEPPGRPTGDIAMELILERAILDRGQGLPDSVTATVSGRVRLGGPALALAALQGDAELTSLAVERGPYRLTAGRSLRLDLERGHLAAVDSAGFVLSNATRPDSAAGRLQVAGSARRPGGLHVWTGGLDLEALAQLVGSRRLWRGRAAGDLRLRGPLDGPELELRWTVPAARIDSLPLGDMRGHLHVAEGDVRLRALDLELSGGRVEATGHMAGATAVDSIGLRLAARDVELAPLRVWLADAGVPVAALAGRVDGDLELSGTTASPALQGSLAVRAGRLRLAGLEPELAFDRAVARLRDDSLHVDGLGAADGSWSLTADARLAGRRPARFTSTLWLEGLPLELPGTMRLPTTGHLRWEGGPDSSSVTGQLRVDGGRITENMSLRTLAFAAADSSAAAVADPRLQRVGLAVGLEGRALRIDNELARAAFAADLVLHGTAARPVLDGELVAADGQVSFLGHEFVLEQGRMAFDRGRPLDDVRALFQEPGRLDPGIDLRAGAEVKARNGNEYSVFLELSGTFNDLSVALISDPPEGESDVLSLLRFGRTGVPMVDARGSMLSTRANLSPNYLLSVTESSFSRVLGLDNVEIDNSVLNPGRLAGSRIVLSKQLGRRTEMTYSTTVGYAAEGRVQLQYDLGSNLFVQTEHDARGESGVDLNLKLKFR